MAGQFFFKLSKCSFAQTLMEYLGHMVSKSGVEPLQEKVQAVQQWPTPCSVKAVRGFLGLSGFYRRFIKEYVTIAVPLTQLLAKDQFTWTAVAHNAFKQLKNAISNAPVLRFPDFALSFVVEIDASRVGMGAVLSQQGHLIAFLANLFAPSFCAHPPMFGSLRP